MPDPLKPWDFFFSYASEDRETGARPLVDELRQRQYAVWWDQTALKGKEAFDDQILSGLKDCHYAVILLSPHFLGKDWPKRELDILLTIEAIDGRSRITFVAHEISPEELNERAPRLARKVAGRTDEGAARVCDRIIETVFSFAVSVNVPTSELDPQIEFPRVRAIGHLKCPRKNCTWSPPPDWSFDPGPQFTFAVRGGQWCVVCDSCGGVVGPISGEDAKLLISLSRGKGIWAPSESPYELKTE